MSDFEPIGTHGQRRLLQQLRTDQWRTAKAVHRVLTTVLANGWIERRDSAGGEEFKLTPAGLEALKGRY